jgi:hypothetical protein
MTPSVFKFLEAHLQAVLYFRIIKNCAVYSKLKLNTGSGWSSVIDILPMKFSETLLVE